MEDEYKVICAVSNRASFDDLSDPEPKFQGYSIVYKRIFRKRCIRSTPCLVLCKGFRGRRIELRYFRFDKIQDGG